MYTLEFNVASSIPRASFIKLTRTFLVSSAGEFCWAEVPKDSDIPKVFPGTVSFQMEAFKWTKGPSHRATRDTSCPLPDGGKLSLWRKLWATVHYVRSSCPVIGIARKNWWKKFKIKRFASGCDETWNSRSIERKEKLSADPLTTILAS